MLDTRWHRRVNKKRALLLHTAWRQSSETDDWICSDSSPAWL